MRRFRSKRCVPRTLPSDGMACGITYDFERTVGSLQSKRLIRCWTKVGTAKPIANPAELLSHLAMPGVFLNKKEFDQASG
jgi:hypothetical protein